ncbi:flavin reductase family protein [Streptomyces sp. NPDC047130]|uniref:flavin reductase family protein n=1 Tax=Streptomyces sp. NPDC047130 TaxID=3155261 RepID=UPI0034040CD3
MPLTLAPTSPARAGAPPAAAPGAAPGATPAGAPVSGTPIGAREFRDAMALLAAPVTIVTALGPDGRPTGFTASSVTSVSLTPPLILLGVTRDSRSHRPLLEAGAFTVNVLARHHDRLARRFAEPHADRFAGGEFRAWPGGGAPYLPDAPLALRCTLAEVLPAGDHDLLLATPVESLTCGSSQALVWYQRAFHTTRHTLQEDTADDLGDTRGADTAGR